MEHHISLSFLKVSLVSTVVANMAKLTLLSSIMAICGVQDKLFGVRKNPSPEIGQSAIHDPCTRSASPSIFGT